MRHADKIVTEIPLKQIWTDTGDLSTVRNRYLGKSEIKEMIKNIQTPFVVADVGQKLIWIDKEKTFDFWKNEVEKHLVLDHNHIDIGNYPDHYAYIASEWLNEDSNAIIVLEKTH